MRSDTMQPKTNIELRNSIWYTEEKYSKMYWNSSGKQSSRLIKTVWNCLLRNLATWQCWEVEMSGPWLRRRWMPVKSLQKRIQNFKSNKSYKWSYNRSMQPQDKEKPAQNLDNLQGQTHLPTVLGRERICLACHIWLRSIDTLEIRPSEAQKLKWRFLKNHMVKSLLLLVNITGL